MKFQAKKAAEAAQGDRGYSGGRWNNGGGYGVERVPDRFMVFKNEICDIRTRKFDKKGKPVNMFLDRDAQFVTACIQCPKAGDMLADGKTVMMMVKAGNSKTETQLVADLLSRWVTADLTFLQAQEVCFTLKELYRKFEKSHEDPHEHAKREAPMLYRKFSERLAKRRIYQHEVKEDGSSDDDDDDGFGQAVNKVFISGAQASELNEIFGLKAETGRPRQNGGAESSGSACGEAQGQQFNIGSGNPREKKMARQVRVDLPMPRTMDFADAAGVPVPMDVGGSAAANNGD